jgi:hypothetical protein
LAEEEEISSLVSLLTTETFEVLDAQRRHANGRLHYEREELISSQCMADVARYAIRDLERLEPNHDDGPSITKYLGYVGFWYAKLKPVGTVKIDPPSGHGDPIEIVDVNEQLALFIMDMLLWRITATDQKTCPHEWLKCDIESCQHVVGDKATRGECYFKKSRAYRTADHGQYAKYIAYALRYRGEGPYFLVKYLDQTVFFSCEKSAKPLYQSA